MEFIDTTYDTEHKPKTTSADSEALSERELQKLRRQIERPRRTASIATKLAAVALTGVAILHTDIAYNKLRLQHTEPVIHTIADALDESYADQTTVYIDGFAGHDGSWITTKMTPAIQAAHDTNTAALEYDRAGISVPEIAQRIADLAERDDLSSVSLHGYSIGGMLTLETAAILQEKYNIPVDRIFLDQSPSSAATIKTSVRNPATTVFVDIMGTANTFGLELEYSGIIRGIFDMVSADKAAHLKQSTTKLMRDQFIYGVNTDVRQSFDRLSQSSPHRPMIIYLSSTSPHRDYMVDLVASETDYHNLAKKYGFDFVPIYVDDAIHSRPDLTIDAYEAAMSNVP